MEGTTNRDSLRCVSCPKLTVWLAANGSEDYMKLKNHQYRSRPRNAYALRQSANCLGLRQRIYFRKREPWTEQSQGKRKQKVNPWPFISSCAMPRRIVSWKPYGRWRGRLNELISAHTNLRHHILCARVSFSCTMSTQGNCLELKLTVLYPMW